jgi:hypothetical protein
MLATTEKVEFLAYIIDVDPESTEQYVKLDVLLCKVVNDSKKGGD